MLAKYAWMTHGRYADGVLLLLSDNSVSAVSKGQGYCLTTDMVSRSVSRVRDSAKQCRGKRVSAPAARAILQ
jgi:hypothetical protein